MFIQRAGAPLFGVLVITCAVVLVTSAPPPLRSAPGSSGRSHAPAIIKQRHGKNATSSNWAGYAVTGADGSVTDAKGSWIVPTVICSAGAPDSYSAFWVGIDGYSSNTVEQIGIDANCVGGSPQYDAWYEFYPHWPVFINTVRVQPRDTISAEIKAGAKGQFTVSLTNITSSQAFSITSKMPSARQSSAEWIVEAPSSSSVLPLANFNLGEFGQDNTKVSNTCYAIVGGKTAAPIGSFGASVVQIDMTSSSGALKSKTSDLSRDGTSFTEAFHSPGP